MVKYCALLCLLIFPLMACGSESTAAPTLPPAAIATTAPTAEPKATLTAVPASTPTLTVTLTPTPTTAATPVPTATPTSTLSPTPSPITFAAVSAGSHACRVKTDGTVPRWGDDGNGKATSPHGSFLLQVEDPGPGEQRVADPEEGWAVSAGTEGNFIGVRRLYDWRTGDYRVRPRTDPMPRANGSAYSTLPTLKIDIHRPSQPCSYEHNPSHRWIRG